jgi:predicted metalloprotease with PDZ domain
MNRNFGRVILAAAMLVGFAMGAAPGSRADADATMHYELKFEAPNTHLMDVTIRAAGLDGKSAEFAIPDWAPGSYYIENYWAYVQAFHVEGADGKALAWRKTDEQTWHIDLNHASSIVVSYQIYGNTLSNNRAQYNERHVFIGGPDVWMYLVNGKERPADLAIAVPNGWRVATGMTRTDESHFKAASYDWFADSPLEISDFKEQTFEFGGTKYHVIDHDIIGQKDFSKFTGDLQKIVATLVPIFSSVAGTPQQEAPFKEYWFLFHVWPNSGGGLEHLNSTQINFRTDWDSMALNDSSGMTPYQLKLWVSAHEFFHAWNVKRLRPRPLGPFDYSRQVHTPSLWISEGLTSYYGSIGMVRAGLMTPQEYLNSIAVLITKFEQEPGRKERSIEDTSWDTWFGRSKDLDTNLANSYYSYYDGGQVVGQLLDLAIRQNTNNAKSLDDWMRLMYSRYALPKPGFEPEDAIKAMTEVAGMDMSDFFHRYISGKEAIPYESYFGYAGVSVEKKADTKAWLGIATAKGDDGHVKITNVIPAGPADRAGLSKEDVVIAIDGRAVTADELTEAVNAHKAGDAIKVTVVRLGELREFGVTLMANPNPIYLLKRVEQPTEMQERIYRSWLGVK